MIYNARYSSKTVLVEFTATHPEGVVRELNDEAPRSMLSHATIGYVVVDKKTNSTPENCNAWNRTSNLAYQDFKQHCCNPDKPVKYIVHKMTDFFQSATSILKDEGYEENKFAEGYCWTHPDNKGVKFKIYDMYPDNKKENWFIELLPVVNTELKVPKI